MRKFVAYLALAIAVPALAVSGVWLRHQVREEARWRDITAQVPSASMSPSGTYAFTNSGWLFSSSTGTYQVGHVVLGDGDVWRFAFASHHVLSGPDSFSVFQSQRGTIRVRGSGFCCEVEFGDEKQPADTGAFAALLRRWGDEVEILR